MPQIDEDQCEYYRRTVNSIEILLKFLFWFPQLLCRIILALPLKYLEFKHKWKVVSSGAFIFAHMLPVPDSSSERNWNDHTTILN